MLVIKVLNILQSYGDKISKFVSEKYIDDMYANNSILENVIKIFHSDEYL